MGFNLCHEGHVSAQKSERSFSFIAADVDEKEGEENVPQNFGGI